MSSTPLLRQHYTLPPTPEHSAESTAESDCDVTLDKHNGNIPRSPVSPCSPSRETLVVFPDDGTMALGTLPDESEERDTLPELPSVGLRASNISGASVSSCGSRVGFAGSGVCSGGSFSQSSHLAPPDAKTDTRNSCDSYISYHTVEPVTSEDRCPHRESINDTRGSRWSINHLRVSSHLYFCQFIYKFTALTQ